MKTIVFSGPSIAEEEVRRLAAATHAPPIKRGDLAVVDDYEVIIILDAERPLLALRAWERCAHRNSTALE